uniref:Uncharacterized protein n=1 Tax=Sphaerodactylus townsendi TaxID=933632 RepID=A0ACB8EV50_9SAUR
MKGSWNLSRHKLSATAGQRHLLKRAELEQKIWEYQFRAMDSRSVLVLLCLLTASFCQPWRAWWKPDRRQPPPVISFLDRLQKIHGEADVRAPEESGLEAGERPPWWAPSEVARSQLNLVKSSIPGHRFPRHALASPPIRGCHLGTCQIQNLANLLYRYGSNNQKDESGKNNKGAADPMGYGRRKRQAIGVPT